MTNQLAPYYSTPDGMIRVFHARWEAVFAAGVFKAKDIALVHADPPYGINHVTNGGQKRSKTSPKSRAYAGGEYGKNWSRVEGDAVAFEPSALLDLKRPMVLWGANHYSGSLPSSSSWLVWEKKRGGQIAADMSVSDAELAWTNLGGIMVRCCYHMWIGFNQDTEVGAHYHPTQKPEALSSWVFKHAMARKKLKRGDTILVPYMGSGPDLRPAQAMGLKVIACEVDESYCRTAVNARLHAVAPNQSDVNLGPLFEARS
jgi:hypothetical protein